MDQARVARAHGAFNVVTGLWPLLHMRSSERVTGPKVEHWLVHTVGGLLVGNGVVQLTATSPEQLRLARTLGQCTAAVLAGVDLANAPRGRISKVYLLDAAAELAWVVLWWTARPARGHTQ